MKNQHTHTRRRFLWLGACTAACATLFSGSLFFRRTRSAPSVKTMLTQDGRLVQVDVTKLSSGNRVASNKEVQEWMKH